MACAAAGAGGVRCATGSGVRPLLLEHLKRVVAVSVSLLPKLQAGQGPGCRLP